MPLKTLMLLCAGGLAGAGLTLALQPPTAESQDRRATAQPPAAPQPAVSPDVERIHATAVAFGKAFNTGNAEAIANLFAENGEIVDEAGALTQGRKAIAARFAGLFQAHPQARIAIEIGAVRLLGPEVAIEDGYSATALTPDDPGVRSPYTVIHVKRDGQWRFASVRDYPPEDEGPVTPHDQLQPLAWLVGHWMDESRAGRVETHCRWSDDGNYLLQDYQVKTRDGRELRGTQRIGYDPLRRTVRAWAFDDSGMFSESFWTPIEGGSWIIKASGVTPDGQAASATRTMTPFANDAFELTSTEQLVGTERLPDSTVRVVRRPPTPGQ
jgi:uncharacterized protein (TIGR02246 family)